MIAAGAKAGGAGAGTVGNAIGGRLGVMSFVSSLNCTSESTFGKEAEEEGPPVDELVLKDTSPKVEAVGVISFGVTGRTGDADSWVEDSIEVLSSDEGSWDEKVPRGEGERVDPKKVALEDRSSNNGPKTSFFSIEGKTGDLDSLETLALNGNGEALSSPSVILRPSDVLLSSAVQDLCKRPGELLGREGDLVEYDLTGEPFGERLFGVRTLWGAARCDADVGEKPNPSNSR